MYLSVCFFCHSQAIGETLLTFDLCDLASFILFFTPYELVKIDIYTGLIQTEADYDKLDIKSADVSV